MIPEGIDGVDFINVYSKGQTDLGRWLSNFARSPIEIPEHGHFESIEGYWYWLSRGRDDRLRQLVGFQAKQLGRSLSRVECPGFEDLIRKAIDIKLKSNTQRLMEFGQSELPLTHYYEYGGKRIDAGYEWIVDHLEHRRTLLKEWLASK